MKEYYSYLLDIYILSLIYEVSFLAHLKRKGELRRRDNGLTVRLACFFAVGLIICSLHARNGKSFNYTAWGSCSVWAIALSAPLWLWVYDNLSISVGWG